MEGAAELDEILTYVEERSSQGAHHVLQRIQDITNLLLVHPQAGQLTSSKLLRRMPATPYPYLVFYQVTDAEIIVHGVRHGARRRSSMPDRR